MEPEPENAGHGLGGGDGPADAGAGCRFGRKEAQGILRRCAAHHLGRGVHAVPGASEYACGSVSETAQHRAFGRPPGRLLECRPAFPWSGADRRPMTPLLDLRITVDYPNKPAALRDLALWMQPGETL